MADPRIAELERKIKARERRGGYDASVAAMKAELEGLKNGD